VESTDQFELGQELGADLFRDRRKSGGQGQEQGTRVCRVVKRWGFPAGKTPMDVGPTGLPVP